MTAELYLTNVQFGIMCYNNLLQKGWIKEVRENNLPMGGGIALAA